jgi:hypothetical protein
VKWVDAAVSGYPAVAYDPDEQILRTRLGGQLPGIYERAVVLCSGIAPRVLSDGSVAYCDVSPEIASRVNDLLRG